MAAQTNFIDLATIWLHAGKGGDGAVSFHREKFVAAGGPDGGDGGRGGDIIFVADDHLSTLMDFRYKRKYTAPEGGKGGASLCHGKNAENLIIKVPLGTVIKDAESGLVIADLSDHTPVTIAKGGRGGYGNAHFATPTRQIPKFAKPGMPGEDIQVTLELKLIADVGLIGFPNVGKSTLISTISAAKPKIANYHFTTLVPTLGVVSVGEGASFVCADIPGLQFPFIDQLFPSHHAKSRTFFCFSRVGVHDRHIRFKRSLYDLDNGKFPDEWVRDRFQYMRNKRRRRIDLERYGISRCVERFCIRHFGSIRHKHNDFIH